METKQDFVDVRLTAKGEAIARGPEAPKDYKGPRTAPCLRIVGGGSRAEGSAEGGYDFVFVPGEALRVTLGEWNAILREVTQDGEPLLEAVAAE